MRSYWLDTNGSPELPVNTGPYLQRQFPPAPEVHTAALHYSRIFREILRKP